MSLLAAGPILVTGTAGFIGFHLAQRLLAEGFEVVGLDSINSYYDPRLKQARLDRLTGKPAGDEVAPPTGPKDAPPGPLPADIGNPR